MKIRIIREISCNKENNSYIINYLSFLNQKHETKITIGITRPIYWGGDS